MCKKATAVGLQKQLTCSGFTKTTSLWKFHSRVSNDFYVYYRDGVCAPLFISHIPLKRPKLENDSALASLRYANPEQVPHTAERLRYFRCLKNLYQSEVADYAGIDHSTYIGYEDCGRDSYPLDKLQKIAELLQVDIVDLLDSYNRFLYDGQGQKVKELRKRNRMTQAEFSILLQTTPGTVKRWEHGQARMTKRMWERMNEITDCNVSINAV